MGLLNLIRGEQQDKAWWSVGLRFTCTGCGKCCGGEPGAVWVTSKEHARMAAFLEMTESQFKKKYLRPLFGRLSLTEQENCDCVFLGRDPVRCSIYAYRPVQCRLFPFWPSILRSRDDWDLYAEDCPGMNAGKLYSAEHIQKLLSGVPWRDL